MEFSIGQKVSYPNHGVCAVESVENKQIDGSLVEFYTLRVLANNSAIFVPKMNAESIGVRPIINSIQCHQLMKILGEDFAEVPPDWKVRVRDYNAKIQSGDVFDVSEVLKQLTFLTYSKQLSFREQRLLEKAKFLVVSELAIVCSQPECDIEEKVDILLAKACQRHLSEKVQIVSVASN
jgi:CarD family transcriptional regulator